MISKEGIRIREMFNSVASRYDLANDVLSLGMHRLWKKSFVEGIAKELRDGSEILDCATGTGDIAILIQKKFPTANVTAIDFSEKMLEKAPQKAEEAGVKRIRFIAADILHLPFSDQSFDHITISFGIRNVEHLLDAIQEIERVLKPKGTFHVLEFGQPKSAAWSKLYSTYHRKALPLLGGMITGQLNAYSYLNKSSEEFASGQEFIKQFPSTAWRAKKVTPLMGGIAYMYRLEKI